MRPTKSQRSSIQFPLDEMLGSPATVRLVRVLAHETRGALSVADVARQAGMTPAGARKALERLGQAGAVSLVGTGRAQKYAIKPDYPYLPVLRQMFELEQRLYDDLIQQLRHAVSMPEVDQAWLDGLPMSHSEALHLTVVVDAKTSTWIGPELRARVSEIEQQADLIVEIAVSTRADEAIPPVDAMPLWGWAGAAAEETPVRGQVHQDSADRSLRMARAVAGIIRTDPSLIRRAQQQTNRLLHEGQGMADGDIGEWRQLLETYSPDRIRDLLVSTSPRAERLRRSSPFFAVLTPEERERVQQETSALDEV